MARNKGRHHAAATPAIAALTAAGVEHTVHTYEATGSDFGDEAARVMGERLGVDAARIFKTLVLETARPPAGSRLALAVAVLPVTHSLDLKAAAAALGCSKLSLAPVDLAEKTTGYVVGGVSPLGQKRPLAHRDRRLGARTFDRAVQRGATRLGDRTNRIRTGLGHRRDHSTHHHRRPRVARLQHSL